MTNATTPKLTNRYVCYTDGRDIRCDAPSLFVSTGGLVGINTANPTTQLEVNGTISATNFIGDGSGLTGVVAGATDRIVSGSTGGTRMVAVSATGYISITQAGANSGWFSPYTGLVTLGVSSTGPVSGTKGYFGRLDIVSTSHAQIVLRQEGLGADEKQWKFHTDPGSPILLGTVTNDNDTRAGQWLQVRRAASSPTYVLLMPSSGTGAEHPRVGIGTWSGFAPTAALQVSGTISATDAIQVGGSTLACSAPIAGALRYSGGNIEFCNGASWGALVGAADAMGDRIVSGTTNAIAWQDRSVTISTGGVQRMVVGEDGNVGIGTATPMPNEGRVLHLYNDGNTGTAASNAALFIESVNRNAHIQTYIPPTGITNFMAYETGVRRPVGGMTIWHDSGNPRVLLYVSNSARMALLNNGNVGVGTLAPASTLQVSGTFTVSNTTQGSTNPSLHVGMNGRVGIGTSAPQTTLDVEGSGRVAHFGNANLVDQYITIRDTTTGAMFGLDADAVDSGGAIRLQTGTNKSILFDANNPTWGTGSGTMVIHRWGAVGIGSDYPVVSLTVVGEVQVSNTGVACLNARRGAIRYTQGTGQLSFCNGSAWTVVGGAGATAAASTTGAVQFNANNALAGDTDNFFWDNVNKRLGIGMNTPLAALTISSSTPEGIRLIGRGTTGAGSGAYISLYDSNGITRRGYIGDASGGDTDMWFAAEDGAKLRLMTGIHSANLVLSDGRVGIQTPTPAATLQVSGTFIVSTSAYADSPSIFVTEAGNVGLGTSSPAARLSLAGAGSSILMRGHGLGSPHISLNMDNTSAGAGGFTLWRMQKHGTIMTDIGVNNATGNFHLEMGGYLNVGGDGSPDLTITPAGNFGVSTVTPLAKLDVNGTISATDAIQVGTSSLACSSGIPGAIRYNGGVLQYCNGTSWTTLGAGGGGGLEDRIVSGTTNAIAWQDSSVTISTNGVQRMIVARGGNVGIGTSLPTAALEISHTVAKIKLNDTSGVYGGGLVLMNSGVTNWTIGGGNDGVDMASLGILNAANNLVFNIKQDGNVGVGGIQSPTATLQVSGTFTVSMTGQRTSPSLHVDAEGNVGIGSISSTAALMVKRPSGNPVNVQIQADHPNAYERVGGLTLSLFRYDPTGEGAAVDFYRGGYGSDAAIVFRTNDGVSFGASATERMRITPRGSVGIGTNAPAISLTVVGEVQVSNSGVACGSTTRGAIRYIHGTGLQYCNGSVFTTLGAGGGGAFEDRIVSGSTNIIAHEDRSLTFTTVNTQRMVVGEDGRVGIGTNVPASNLHVAMDGSPMLRISGAGSSLSNAAFLSLERYRGTNATPGYTTPGDWLGVINFLGYTSERRIGAAIRGYADDGWGTTGADSPGALVFFTTPDGTGTLQERVRLDSAGRMGIGTGSPTATLTVSGTISATDAIQVGSSSLACSSGIPGAIKYNAGSLQYCNGTSWTSLSASGGGQEDRIVSGTTNAIAWQDSSLTISTNGVRRVTVGANGRTGFGTSSPGMTLDVSASFAGDGVRVFGTTPAFTLSNAAGTSTSTFGQAGNNGQFSSIATPGDGVLRAMGGDLILSALSPLHNIYFTTGSPTDSIKMAILQDGSVGVGTATPTAALQVSGTFSVSSSSYVNSPTFYVDALGRTGIGVMPSSSVLIGGGLHIQNNGPSGHAYSTVTGLLVENNGISPGFFVLQTMTAGGGKALNVTNAGNVGISNTVPRAKLDVIGTISASDAIQVGTSALACSSVISGSIRYSAVSSTMEYCQGTAWVSMGPSATSVPAFSVHKNGTNQTVGNGVHTKLTFSTKELDTYNNFNTGTSRFTPTVPGIYLLTASSYCNDNTTYCQIWIYKNATPVMSGVTRTPQEFIQTTAVVSMNGTTDYAEVYVQNGGGVTISGHYQNTRFAGSLIASGNGLGGAGGGSDNLGNHTATQALDMGGYNINNAGTIYGTGAALGGLTVTGASSLTTVSTSLIQVGTGLGAACTSGISGSIRYSAVSSTMEYCNGNAWASLGPSDTVPVSFHVDRNSTNQTVVEDSWTKIEWTREIYDSNNNFASDRFTPTVPGRYLITGAAACGTSEGCIVSIYKNGVRHLDGNFVNTTSTSDTRRSTVAGIVSMNGTGDYVELFVSSIGNVTLDGSSTRTYFQGVLLGPQGGSGGGSDNLGNHIAEQNLQMGVHNIVGTGVVSVTNVSASVVQVAGANITAVAGGGGNYIASGTTSISASSNGTLKVATAGSQRLIVDSNGRVGIGTSSPAYTLTVSGSTSAAVYYLTDVPGPVLIGDATVLHIRTKEGTTIKGAGISMYNEDHPTYPNTLNLQPGPTSGIWLRSNGYVSIGHATPGYRLDLPNTADLAGRGRANQWVTYSDGRFKIERKVIEDALDKVLALQGITYRSSLAKDTEQEIGFIAQDVEKVVPEVVSIASTTVTLKDGTEKVVQDYRSLDYARLVPVLVEAIKEMKAANDNNDQKLRAEIDALRGELQSLRQANKK